MSSTFTAYIEFDAESRSYIGIVPGISGAHTQAPDLNMLMEKLKEVLALCLEEIDEEELRALPNFVGVQQIEVAL